MKEASPHQGDSKFLSMNDYLSEGNGNLTGTKKVVLFYLSYYIKTSKVVESNSGCQK